MPSIWKQNFSPKLIVVLGIVGPLFTYIIILIAISLAPWFSWTGNALSDLGNIVTHTSSAPVFNYGLMIGGVIITWFAIGMVLEVKNNVMGLLGALTLVTSGLGIFFVGVFPENFLLPHAISAFTYFISILVGSLFFGIAYVGRKSTKMLGILVLILGIVALFGLFMLPSLIQLPGYAIPEMIGSVAQYIWVLMICARMLTGKDAIPKK